MGESLRQGDSSAAICFVDAWPRRHQCGRGSAYRRRQEFQPPLILCSSARSRRRRCAKRGWPFPRRSDTRGCSGRSPRAPEIDDSAPPSPSSIVRGAFLQNQPRTPAAGQPVRLPSRCRQDCLVRARPPLPDARPAPFPSRSRIGGPRATIEPAAEALWAPSGARSWLLGGSPGWSRARARALSSVFSPDRFAPVGCPPRLSARAILLIPAPPHPPTGGANLGIAPIPRLLRTGERSSRPHSSWAGGSANALAS